MGEAVQPKKKKPRVKIDISALAKLAALQCTVEEAAAFFGCCKVTMIRRLRHPAYQQAWDIGKQRGRMSLRRLQWKHANGIGSSAVAMSIHLSKHWLGESERSLIEMTGKDGGPVSIEQNLDLFSDEELAAFEKLMEKLAKRSQTASPKPGS